MKSKLLLSILALGTVCAVTGKTALAEENTGNNTTTDVGIGFKTTDDNSVVYGRIEVQINAVRKYTTPQELKEIKKAIAIYLKFL